jgi:hypothetical protein
MTTVLPLHAGHPSNFGAGIDQTDMEHSSTSGSPGHDDALRGRRRNRESENGEEDDRVGDAADGEGTGTSKKRRRSRKGLDKKFQCPQEGCGKSYSRAEHLYRHQLNREPTFPASPA